MRRIQFTCDRCGADLTLPKMANKCIDASCSFTVDHLPTSSTQRLMFHTGQEIDLCYDCYCKLVNFFKEVN